MGDRDWLGVVAGIRRWSQNGVRAPHKPLLLLFMLGRVHRGQPGPVGFVDVEGPLADLLRDYGPARTSVHPEFPFHHLTSDGLWDIKDRDGSDARPMGTAVTRLRAAGVTGQLSAPFEAALGADPLLLPAIVRMLLDANFPETLHAELAGRVGIDLAELDESAAGRRTAPQGRRRDPTFSAAVLVAYEYRCAMCGYDGWLSGQAVGLEAAHVRWWAVEGPDDIANALALCALHHRLFDKGVLGITEQMTVAVSQLFVGRADSATRLVTDLVGQPLLQPQRPHPSVAETHRRWHATQVFRSPARV